MKALKWTLIIFIALIVIGVMVDPKKEPTDVKDQQASITESGTVADSGTSLANPSEATFTTTAAELSSAYDDNTVAADQRFKGSRYKVSGTVASINTDLFGRPYITLRGGVNEFAEPQFSFSKENAAALAQLHKGTKVTLVCTGKGDIAKTAMSDDCAML